MKNSLCKGENNCYLKTDSVSTDIIAIKLLWVINTFGLPEGPIGTPYREIGFCGGNVIYVFVFLETLCNLIFNITFLRHNFFGC